MTKPPGALKLRPHSMTRRLKHFPWPVCKHCGLVGLRNKATKKALRVGCWLYSDEVTP
jgi:hypothetical protein